MIHQNGKRGAGGRLFTISAAILLTLFIAVIPALAEKTQAEGTVYDGDYRSAYRPVINMYRTFENSGFTVYDPFLSDTLLARAKSDPDVLIGMDMEIKYLALQFSLHDLNGDETPELLIRAVGPARFSTILSAYTLNDGTPVSVLQKQTGREEIIIRESGVINRGWSHMGIVTDLYCTLAPGAIELTLEDGLYTDWNQAAGREAYTDLENAQIIQYGDHYKGLTVLIPENTATLTLIGQEEWAELMTDYEAGRKAPLEDAWHSLSAYPGGK